MIKKSFLVLLQEISDFVEVFCGHCSLVVVVPTGLMLSIKAGFSEPKSSAKKKIRRYFKKISQSINNGKVSGIVDDAWLAFKTIEFFNPSRKDNFVAELVLQFRDHLPELVFKDKDQKPEKSTEEIYSFKDLDLG